MKILAIRLKNLASIEGQFECDFTKEPLKSAGIFAITGPTGSGKSTILDALCLALYGKTPRYLQAKENGIFIQDVTNQSINQNDVRAILRRGSSEGFAEVDFIGVDSIPYRSTWSVRRARNNPDGSLQNVRIEVSNLLTKTLLSGTNTELQNEIVRLVGLNFEQFTRSVLLAQGDFTAFLKAGKDEKAELLEKLTGTSIYSEISKFIFERSKNEKNKLDVLIQQLGSIALLNEDQLIELKKQVEYSKSIEADLVKELEAFKNEQRWQNDKEVLEQRFNEATLTFEHALTQKNHSAHRETYLSHVEASSVLKSTFDSLHEKELSAKENEKLLIVLNEKLGSDSNALQQIELKQTELNNNLQKVQQDWNISQPKLQEARKLELLLTENQKKINLIRENQHKVEQQKTELKLQIASLKQTESNIILEKQIQEKWLEEHLNQTTIFNQFTLFKSKLIDASTSLRKIENLTNNQGHYSDFLTNEIETVQLFKSQIQHKSIECKQLNSNRDELYNKWKDIPYLELEEQKSQLIKEKEEFRNAEISWKFLQKLIHEKEEKSTSRANFILKKEQEEINLPLLKNELGPIELELKQIEQKRETVKLALVENVEHLRTLLKENEPCPVCGSTSHPYNKDTFSSNSVLNQLDDSFNLIKLQYQAKQKEIQEFELGIWKLAEEIRSTTSDLLRLETQIQHSLQGLRTFPAYKKFDSVPENDRTDWFDTHENELNQAFIRIQKQLNIYLATKNEWDLATANCRHLEKEINDLTLQLKDKENQIQLIESKKIHEEKELVESNLQFDSVAKELNKLFGHSNWVDEWKGNPDQFIAQWNDDFTQWKLAKEKLVSYENQLIELSKKLNSETIEHSNLSKERQKIEDTLIELNQEEQNLLIERNSLFNGQEVSLVEEKLRVAIVDAQNNINKNIKEAQHLQIAIAQLKTSVDASTKIKRELTVEISNRKQTITNWLNTYNEKNNWLFSVEDLNDWLSNSIEWISEEKRFIESLSKAVQVSQTVMTERSESLSQHLHSFTPKFEKHLLTELITQNQEKQVELVKSRNTTEIQISNDEQARKHQHTLIEQKEKQQLLSDNWARINNLIGSSDGKKFRQIAQEYTLEILLEYANIHLETLSKRYVLQRIPETLSMQISDLDMGNEIRTVYSLSGGESFLVSLALALGLASLTSNRMQVESLFIDEGFGSLDPQTLQIAMDALERLQNQGRKVGVISHVQEMTERIPVQIKVNKLSGGKSTLEVV